MQIPCCMRNNSLDEALSLEYNPGFIDKIKINNKNG